jgi:hypothetical protein
MTAICDASPTIYGRHGRRSRRSEARHRPLSSAPTSARASGAPARLGHASYRFERTMLAPDACAAPSS